MESLSSQLVEFIDSQPMFFVATAAPQGRVNVSPKGMDMTLRVYGQASVVHPRDEQWRDLVSHFPTLAGSRQIFDTRVDEALTSCGTGVPVMSLRAVRADEELEPDCAAMREAELHDYWAGKNSKSIDGYPTAIFAS